jgi:hypothetical protein
MPGNIDGPPSLSAYTAWVKTGSQPFLPHVSFRQLRTLHCIGFGPSRADIVAKVPNRWELIFLLLKKSTDDR